MNMLLMSVLSAPRPPRRHQMLLDYSNWTILLVGVRKYSSSIEPHDTGVDIT